MMRNERRSTVALESARDARLRRLVHHAYERVPFYRRLFDREGLIPADIQTAQDLQKLPVIDKASLKTQPLSELLGHRGGIVNGLTRLSTSGSSGTPFDVYLDSRSNQLRKAQSLRPYLTNGRRLADHCMHFTGHSELKPKWFERLGFLRERRIDSNMPHALQLKAINAWRPEVIQGYPSALTSLAASVRDEGLPVHKARLVFTDSELLTSQSRRLIGDTLGGQVIDVYGAWETGNIAYECERHSGYHVAIDCVILEVVTGDGTPARAGTEGELVCTVLDNLAMPLIRYNLHDVAAYSTAACACQRSFPLLHVISGRSNDQLRLVDGRTMSPEGLLARFDSMSAAVREYQVVQEALDRFRIVVVPGARFDEAAGERIRSVFTSWHPSAHVTIDIVDRIPREASGKRRTFRSHSRDSMVEAPPS